jgi:Outer membrane protein beta-barrel domain
MTNEAFDHIIKEKLEQFVAPIPAGLWDRINLPSSESPEASFDALFKNQLAHYSAPVPSDMWNRIKPEEEEKRPALFLLPRASMIAASILLLMITGSVASYLYFKNAKINTHIESSATASSTKKILSNKQKNTPSKTVVAIGSIDSLNTIKPSSIQQELSPSIESKMRITIDQNSSSLGSLKTLNKTTKANPFELYQLPINKKEKRENNLANPLLDEHLGVADQQLVVDENEWYKPMDKLNASYLFETRKKALLNSEKKITAFNHAKSIKNVVICPTDRKVRNPDWDLEVYASPDYAFKSVTNNSANQQFLDRKDSSESSQISYSAGFRIVKPLNDHFSIKTGLHYSQINEKFTYRTENEVRTTTVVTVRTIIRAPGDTVIVNDTSTLQQIGFKNNTIQNRYRSIDIPVLIGYQFGNDDLRIGINAGLLVNLTSWYQGVILDSTLAPLTISKDNNPIYKTNLGLGLYAGISVSKRLNYNTHLFVEPYMRYNLSNMTNSRAIYNQRFTIGGLSIGLRFNLNNR